MKVQQEEQNKSNLIERKVSRPTISDSELLEQIINEKKQINQDEKFEMTMTFNEPNKQEEKARMTP